MQSEIISLSWSWIIFRCFRAFSFGVLLSILPSQQYYADPSERFSLRDVIQFGACVKSTFRMVFGFCKFLCLCMVEVCYSIAVHSSISPSMHSMFTSFATLWIVYCTLLYCTLISVGRVQPREMKTRVARTQWHSWDYIFFLKKKSPMELLRRVEGSQCQRLFTKL